MNRRLDADVAIIGAGPAGSVTAALVAREGFDVLLVDRHAFPRPKPCGDCLSPEASRVLDRLGALDDVAAAAPARLDGWRVVGPRRAMLEARFIDICNGDARLASALALDRARLDAVLLRYAIRAGVRFFAPVHVTRLAGGENGTRRLEARTAAHARARSGDVAASAGAAAGAVPVTIRAPLIIGADGLRSVIARDIGAHARPPRRRKLSFTAHVMGVRDVTSIGELHVAQGACVGIAPVSTDPICNVTLVVDSERFGRDAAGDPAAFFTAMLERFPGVRGRLREASPVEHGVAGRPRPLLASGSFDRPARRITADGVALVGDAAGYFDPFTGQGIYHALAGAEMLARAACHALARPGAGPGAARDALREYARRYTDLIRPVHRLQRVIDAVLRRPALADAMIDRLGRRPAAARALLAVTGDVRRPASLLSPTVLLSLASPI